MPTLNCCCAPPSQYMPLGFHLPSSRASTPTTITLSKLGTHISPPPFNFRFKNAVRLQVRQRSIAVYASNDNASEKSDSTITSDAAQGPPFLTILAGFLVFSLVCWILGSIVVWLIGLIVHSPPSK